MSFRRGGAKKRRDAVEPAIVHALNALGVTTWQLHGTGLPDLLCYHHGKFTPLEVKSKGGLRTPAQQHIPWLLVQTVEEALAALGIRPLDVVPRSQWAPLSGPLARKDGA